MSNYNSDTAFTPLPFHPPMWLKNPHLQTILPRFLVKFVPNYQRELVKDSLNESEVAFDFLWADDKKDAQLKYTTPLVVLFHGMEGSSQSHYARTLAKEVHEAGYHFVVVHFRSCGGVAVQGDVFYNAGDTAEMHHNLAILAQRFTQIYAVGVSIGGNVLAKYMGEYGDRAIACRAVVISAPLDLASSAVAMQRLLGRRVYTPYLLNPIIKKALDNRLDANEMKALKRAKSIEEFDEIFTAPRHGFLSKNDYYRRASALPDLINITKPTLIITAMDDPFLGIKAVPGDVSDCVLLCDVKYGGHIGFVSYDYKNRSFCLDFIAKNALRFFGLTY